MPMNLIIFEDDRFTDFEPLSISHPVYALLCGTSRIYAKWIRALKPKTVSFLSRPYLAASLELETGIKTNAIAEGEGIFVNGRFLPSKEILAALRKLSNGEGLESDGALMAFRLDTSQGSEFADGLSNLHESAGVERIRKYLKEKRAKAGAIKYLWDMVEINGERISAEFKEFHGKAKSTGKIDPRASIINRRMVSVVRGASVGPQAVIDATEGPVIIEKDAVVEPLTYIKGPCYVGQGSRLVGGNIRDGCSFGPACRVGGEVEETIMLGYCNKYHDGFLGHAYLGEWVNLGAMTTNSDLKNNYTPISVFAGGQLVNSGKIKVGCFIGDHTKTGIGTLLNTGISIGFSCNLYGGGFFAERSIKSFSWGTPGNLAEYEIEKAIRTAAASMARRGIEFGEIHERLFREISAMRRPEDRL